MSNLFEIRWTDSARADLDSIINYIAGQDGIQPALGVYEKIMDKADSLTKSPERCRVVPELKKTGLSAYREMIVKPYRIFFHIDNRKVILLGILDGRRDLEQLLIERALGSF